ncbi:MULTISPECIES: S8 family serine peptidase [Micromonospora]|uniref:Serine protease n=1 Tax=Micromonospora solifontis TaxID=2487138 RepID=A0ABX9WLF7_9ACTN|nr:MULTISPECIES: S8 family serine peptidase [Micromonospora]NES14319.1 S8 family serine peptidase [Micromonospora sp. PPF5-17B]NES35073.1 S8 family serine peptidase [Micromonospora solifontis]NES57746.1 S8 family serine peptidase [Micromonospora sp. PPF5-6]RNM01343.1 serine protease [Micromonospora solifontis]
MSQPRNRSRRTAAGLFASVLAAGAMTAGGGAATASAAPAAAPEASQPTAVEALGAHDAKLLNEAKAKKAPTVTMIIAASKGSTKKVADGLKSLGAAVSERYDEVGYVLAKVPTAKAVKAATLPGVSAVDLDETIPLPDPTPEAAPDGKKAARQGETLAGPGADTGAVNPYMPTNETGAEAFKAAHPTWDGRGVTIGIMDSGVDLDQPALQQTTTGERKIVDWITATDPLEDPSWRRMNNQVAGPTFTIAGATWTAPAGTYRFNLFSESITRDSDARGDVNRDGDTTDTWGILYNPTNGDIRVDANQNNDFTDDEVMRPYKERFQVGHFGTDNPATPVREQIPFVVEYRRNVDTSPIGVPGTSDYVNIGIIESTHGTHVAGITAANGMLGNSAFNGAAPGAKLVSARACSWGGGCTYAALTTGMVDLVVNRKVDVINMSIGGLPALNDGANARTELYNNLITTYGVQMFISAGNSGPGVNTVGDPSVAGNVVSVAASISKDTWLANYGSVVRKKNALFNFSSRGPREDGGFKPNIAAPGSAISTAPTWQPGNPVPEAGYPLPPGYQMLNGTSMASPQATGAAALLLSAARATDKAVTPAALRRAIYTSAKPIADVPTYAQGYGMFNVPGAWSLLSGGVETRSYTSEAPVCTELSANLTKYNRDLGIFEPSPNVGTGIHNRCAADRGGQKVNESRQYEVKLTRTSGPNKNIKHDIAFRGNDGTFSAPKTVALPLNQPVTVKVTAKPKAAGVHGAIMTVDDPATSVVDFEVATVVVASNDVTAPKYSFSAEGSVERNSFTSYFVTVPPGTGALQVNLSGIATGSQSRFIAFNPYGVPVETTASTACYTNFSDPAVCRPQSRSYQNPIPGVWEIEVEARRTSPSLDNPFQLQAQVQGVKVDPAVLHLPSVTAGEPSSVSWSLTNTFGPVSVTGVGGPLSSVHAERPTIAEGATQEFTVDIPAGVPSFTVRIGNPANPAADLDLYVFRGNTQVGRSAGGSSEEVVTITNPEPATYRVVVDGYAVDGTGGSTAYDYRDSFASPALGSVSAPATSLALANGATAALTGTVTALAAPAAGRELYGDLAVTTTAGAVVGRGAVSIGAVN